VSSQKAMHSHAFKKQSNKTLFLLLEKKNLTKLLGNAYRGPSVEFLDGYELPDCQLSY
jgi:hypothetical protein